MSVRFNASLPFNGVAIIQKVEEMPLMEEPKEQT